jgi:ABC-type sugar transport system ATPase subunit
VTDAATAGEAPDSTARPPAVSVRGLVKRYGEVEAVSGIDFDVTAGEILGFPGPNGAGKSTTIGMLCTLVRPTGGHARVAGHDVGTERDDVRRNIGLVFQDTTRDGYLTAEQRAARHLARRPRRARPRRHVVRLARPRGARSGRGRAARMRDARHRRLGVQPRRVGARP